MAHLPEGVRLLPSGKFQARYKAPDGSRRTLGTYSTCKEAVRAIALKEAEIAEGSWLDDRKSDIPFEQFAWMVFDYKEKSLSRATVVNHRSILRNHLFPAFGQMALKDIRPRHVDQWFAHFSGGKVIRQHAYALMNNYMNHATRWEFLRANPCQVQGGMADACEERPAFGVEDFRKVLAQTSGEFRVALLVAFSGHLRAGEVSGLNVGDFDPHKGTLTVSRSVSKAEGLKSTKTGKTKTVVLMDQGAEALKGHLKKKR